MSLFKGFIHFLICYRLIYSRFELTKLNALNLIPNSMKNKPSVIESIRRSLRNQTQANRTSNEAGNTGLQYEVVEKTKPDIVYKIEQDEIVEIGCPNGNLINILNSVIICDNKEVDIFEDLWSLCRNKTYCELEVNNNMEKIYESYNCQNVKKFKYVEYTCSKLLNYDCGLFYPYNKKNEKFCLSICLNYIKNCLSKVNVIPREYLIKCLKKMFFRNSIHQCGFLPESIFPEDVSFSFNNYIKPKYYVDKLKITNKKWLNYKFKYKIENPIIFTSIPYEGQNVGDSKKNSQSSGSENREMKILINNVTNVGFNAKLLLVACDQNCIENKKAVEKEILFMALSRGNHSSNLNNQIVAGSLDSEASNMVKLPLDPQYEWLILVQIQNVVYLEGKSKPVGSPGPLIYTSILSYNNRHKVYYSYNNQFNIKSVIIGYLAISVNNNLYTLANAVDPNSENMYNINKISLYNIEMIYFEKMLNLVDEHEFKIKLKLNFSSRNFFTSTNYNSLTINSTNIEETIYTLSIKSVEPVQINNNLINYMVRLDSFKLSKNTSLSEGPKLSVLYVENNIPVAIKNICTYTHHIDQEQESSEPVNSKNELSENTFSTNCFIKCTNGNRIKECIGHLNEDKIEEFIKCYRKSGNCQILNNKNVIEIIKYNKDLLLSQYNKVNSDNITRSSETGTKAEDKDQGKVIAGSGGSLPKEINAVNEEVIYSEWQKWSKCNSVCDDNISKLYKIRRRLLYYKNSQSTGNNESQLNISLTETKPCENPHKCKELCYYRTLHVKNKEVTYYFIHNKNCMYKQEPIAGRNMKSVNTSNLSEANVKYNENCDKEYNWSKCDSPCYDKSSPVKPKKYLLVNILCQIDYQECTNLKECEFENGNNSSKTNVDYKMKTTSKALDNENKCTLYNSVYDEKWVENGNCLCPKGTVICTSSEIYYFNSYYNGKFNNINNNNIFNNTKDKVSHTSSTTTQNYISLYNYEKIIIPSNHLKVITYDKFNTFKELNNFCATGNVNYNKLRDNLLLVNCDNIYMSVENKDGEHEETKDNTCREDCKNIETICDRNHNFVNLKTLTSCIINEINSKSDILKDATLKSNVESLYNKDMTVRNNNYLLSLIETNLINMICTDNDNNSCKSLIISEFNNCKQIQFHNTANTKIRECINDHFIKINNFNNMSGNNPHKCVFGKKKVIGNGLVYCKKLVCEYNHYSKYFYKYAENNSALNAYWMDIEKLNEVKLKELKNIKNEIKKSLINTFEIDDHVITKVLSKVKVKFNIKIRYRNVVNNNFECRNLNEQISVLINNENGYTNNNGSNNINNNSHNSNNTNIDNNGTTINGTMMDGNSLYNKESSIIMDSTNDIDSNRIINTFKANEITNKYCNIYLGQKQGQNTKLIIQTNKCNCPINTEICSIKESINNRNFIRTLNNICVNKMSFILFINGHDYYRFSCLSKSFIKEDFDSIRVICNEENELIYISCHGELTLFHIYLKSIVFLISGILLSLTLSWYYY